MIVTSMLGEIKPPVHFPPSTVEPAVLVAVLAESDGLFAIVQLGKGQRAIPVDWETLERFTDFSDFIRHETGRETRPPRRRWRDAVKAAVARGAVA